MDRFYSPNDEMRGSLGEEVASRNAITCVIHRGADSFAFSRGREEGGEEATEREEAERLSQRTVRFSKKIRFCDPVICGIL